MINREPYNATLDHPDYYEDLEWLDADDAEEPEIMATTDIISPPAAILFVLVLFALAIL